MQYDVKQAPEAAPPRELTRKSVTVAIAATVGLMTSSPSITQAPIGLLVVPVTHAFNIGRGEFGLFVGAAMLVGAVLTPFAGQAMDRYGVRRVVLPGIIALGVYLLAMAALPISVPLLATVIVLGGISGCLVTPMPYAKVLSLWFFRRRGIMLGTGSAIGIGGGSGLCAGLVGLMLGIGGWRAAYLGPGIYVLLVGALVVWPFLREPPKIEAAEHADVPPDLPGITLKEALRTRSFLLILLVVFSSLGALATMMGHGPALLTGRGLGRLSTIYLICASLGSLSGQLLSGFLLDKVDSPKVGIIFAIATMLGSMAVLYLGFSAAVVVPAALMQGIGQGAETGLASYYISRFCGLRSYASIFGIVMALVTLSAGIFPPIAGFVFDRTGSYNDVIPLLDVLLVIPPIAIFFLPRYRFKAVQPVF